MGRTTPQALERPAALAEAASCPRASAPPLRELIGEDLWQLIGRLGPRLVGADRITTVVSGNLPRAAFRLCLEDGTELKGRRLETVAQARTVERLARLADTRHFAVVVARRRAALLEEWRPGVPLEAVSADPGWLEHAGEALGALHVTAAGRASRGRSRRIVGSTLARVERRLRELEGHDVLRGDEASEVLRKVRAAAPAHAASGLAHGDYCGENLVLSDGAVVAIDNECLHLGALDYDLARTWVRWPMNAAQRLAFSRGYCRHRSLAAFERHRPFWLASALLDSAAFRARAGVPTLGATLAELRGFAALKRVSSTGSIEPADWEFGHLVEQ